MPVLTPAAAARERRQDRRRWVRHGRQSRPAWRAKYSHVSTFGAILDSWVVAANSTPGTLAPVPGVDGGPGTGTLVEIDTTDGMPATPVLGSVKLTIPFDQPNEEMLFAQNMNGLNMKGETVTAYIKLNSGLNTGPVNVGQGLPDPEDDGGVQLRRGAVDLARPHGGLGSAQHRRQQPAAAAPPGYDPCDVREIDVSVQTGATGTYTTAVMHIDTIAIGVPGAVDDGGTGTP